MVHLSSLPAYHVMRTSGSIPCYRTTQPLLWLDYSKQAGGQFLRIRLKIAKKCCLYLDMFSCVKINVFRSFFAFRLEMHVRCDNLYKTGADGGPILGQPIPLECMGICVLSLAHESEMRGYLVYVLIVKKLISLILFKFSHSILDLTVLSWNFGGIFWGNIFRGVCRPYHV